MGGAPAGSPEGVCGMGEVFARFEQGGPVLGMLYLSFVLLLLPFKAVGWGYRKVALATQKRQGWTHGS